MAVNLRLSLVIAAILLAIAFLLLIVVEGLPMWGNLQQESEPLSLGLWLSCSTIEEERICLPMICSSESESMVSCPKLIAARVFITLACSLSGAATFFLVVYIMTCDNRNQVLLVSIKFFAASSVVMGIVGVVIGVQTLGIRDGIEIGIASIISIIAIIINFFGAVAILLVKHRA